MKLSNEMLQKAKECKTVEELLNLAKENDYTLTEEDATAKFNEWHKIGELADEELDNVSGGGCDNPITCPNCGSSNYFPNSHRSPTYYYCSDCNYSWNID